MLHTFEFNTGRHYGPDGQLVKVEVVREVAEEHRLIPEFREFVVHFDDTTRHIRGEVIIMADHAALVGQRDVMNAYDAGNYTLR